MLQSQMTSLLPSSCLKLDPEGEVEAANFGQPRFFLKAVMRIVKSLNCSIIFTTNSYNFLCIHLFYLLNIIILKE